MQKAWFLPKANEKIYLKHYEVTLLTFANDSLLIAVDTNVCVPVGRPKGLRSCFSSHNFYRNLIFWVFKKGRDSWIEGPLIEPGITPRSTVLQQIPGVFQCLYLLFPTWLSLIGQVSSMVCLTIWRSRNSSMFLQTFRKWRLWLCAILTLVLLKTAVERCVERLKDRLRTRRGQSQCQRLVKRFDCSIGALTLIWKDHKRVIAFSPPVLNVS